MANIRNAKDYTGVSNNSITYGARELAWSISLVFLFLRFFTPISPTNLYLGYSVLILFCSIMWLARNHSAFSTQPLGISGFGLCIAILIIVTFSPYGKTQLLKISIFVLDAYLLVAVLGIKEHHRSTRIFYLCSTAVIIVTFIIFLVNPNFFFSIPGAQLGLIKAPILYGVPDSNETALVIFIYFCLVLKKRWKVGIALGLVYPFLYFGRQYIMMLCVIAVVLLVEKIWPRMAEKLGKRKHDHIKLEAWHYYLFFIISTSALILLSLFWVSNVSNGIVDQYKQSINDSSNAIRMNSDVYCLEVMLGDPRFILYGYDSDVYSMLGISDTDFSPEANYLVNGRYRLVQPHEEVLNTLLKEGLLFTLFYYGLISRLFTSIPYEGKNRAIFVSYLIGSLFLSAFFRDFRLIAFIILMTSDEIPSKGRNYTMQLKK